jgi:hypothetical protein
LKTDNPKIFTTLIVTFLVAFAKLAFILYSPVVDGFGEIAISISLLVSSKLNFICIGKSE